MNMIECVARAVHKAQLDLSRIQFKQSDEMWRAYVPLARVAIEAMREPTKEMDSAGVHAEQYRSMGILKVRRIWSDMISAALKEE